ncbi:heat shock 90 domain-containing protein (plasmid) [Rhizobium etli bv. mimosae str. Mim1]|nr:heat shock 90 domain-containing protein [Rhizobium etli bv. mimosae str. Mim1]
MLCIAYELQQSIEVPVVPHTSTVSFFTTLVSPGLATFIGFAREKLAGQVADVRASERLTESAVCLVAPEDGYDRQMEKILQNAGRLQGATKLILEIAANCSRVRYFREFRQICSQHIRAISNRVADTLC